MLGLLGIVVFILLIAHFRLRSRVNALTALVLKLEAERNATPQADAEGDWPKADISQVSPVMPKKSAATPAPRSAQAPVHDDVKIAAQTPSSFVFNQSKLQSAVNWIRDNWFLGVAAISLALAGVFMVQYSVEQGLLTPFARIMGALGMGAAFIALGEVIRRRFGDEGGTLTALPSTFAGAGIVTLFAAVLSARHLYGMLPSDLAFFALVAIAALAIALGWFYGPFMAAVGVIGALGAPFVVGGSSDAPHLFFYYFALIVVMALAIDTVRRWAWVSVLALIGGFTATWMLLVSGAEGVHALVFALIATIAACAVPVRRIWPNHSGAMLSDVALKLRKMSDASWPEFPTRLVAGTFIAAMALSALMPFETSGYLENWLAIWAVFALGLLALIWMERAPALEDLSALAPLTLLVLLVLLPQDNTLIFQEFSKNIELGGIDGAPMPKAVSLFFAMFAAFAALGFWRASNGVRGTLIWIGASAFALPVALGALEIFWSPSNILGSYLWAGHAIIGAALMTLLTERSVKRWSSDMRPAALFAMSALSLIVFALMLVLSTAALSVAIAVMIVLAAFIDRRLDMPWLGLFIQAAVAIIGWRFIVDPGFFWATDSRTALWEVILGQGIPLMLMAFAWYLLRPLKRSGAQLALESAVWALGAVFILAVLKRILGYDFEGFWGLGLAGSVLLTSMGAQLYRWRSTGSLRWVRLALAALFGFFAFAVLFIGLVAMAPIQRWAANEVVGPLLFDTIAVGYLVPAGVFAVLVWKLKHVHRYVRGVFAAAASLLVTAYVAFEIHRFWQGGEMTNKIISQGELYSYTIAMMIASVGMLFVAFARRSTLLRRLAMLGIALTIAKVFLVDMSELTGLIRVASFLGLGLALSVLAWLSRAMTARWEREE